ncbi:putative trafficking protein particle complex subunit 12 [Paratrimastix pyriformis]|uniref:Trafficking protein particle complex subunit 12 n=1 Tax=Paratrimastix pyriformis TaxID=342808 RepID=A0ABQ8UAS7_9EUKA|nr:putative trafficking protein particle complex subunit 12 [Paratrimastix pyriformis]
MAELTQPLKGGVRLSLSSPLEVDPLSQFSTEFQPPPATYRKPPPAAPSLSDPVLAFLTRNVQSRPRLRASDLPKTVQSLKLLMQHESWMSALDLTDLLPQALWHTHRPRILMCRAICWYKLGKYSEVDVEFAPFSSIMLTSHELFIPFALRLLYARLPLHQEDPSEAMSRLYKLVRWCKDHVSWIAIQPEVIPTSTPDSGLSSSKTPVGLPPSPAPLGTPQRTPPPFRELSSARHTTAVDEDPLAGLYQELESDEVLPPPASSTSPAALSPASSPSPSPPPPQPTGAAAPPATSSWSDHAELRQPPTRSQLIERTRQDLVRVYLALATFHTGRKDYALALNALGEALPLSPAPEVIWSHVCRVLIEMGDLAGAQRAVARMEQTAGQRHALVSMMRGLLAVAQGDTDAAIGHFKAVLELEPTNTAAANNLSICYLMKVRVDEAITTLEQCIREDPYHTLNTTLLDNLAQLYDIGHPRATERKSLLVRLTQLYGPEHIILPGSLASVSATVMLGGSTIGVNNPMSSNGTAVGPL